MNIKNIKKLIPVLLVICLLSGCWDKVEIDRRSFVLTLGIDAGEEISKVKDLKKLKPDEPFTDNNMKVLNITYAFPDISQLSPEKGGVAEDKSINVDAYSMEDAFSKATSRSSREISFGHSKLILFGTGLFAYPDVAKEVLDYLQRQPAVNRNTLVVIAEGKVEDYIKNKTLTEKNIQGYISGLVENSDRNSSIIPLDLNEFLQNLSETGNAIMPLLSKEEGNKGLQLLGSGIIKNYEFKGTLSPTETSNVKMVRGKLKGGKKVIYKDGHPIDFEIDGMERKIKVTGEDNKLIFNIDINLEGEIKGYYLKEEIYSENVLEEIENNFNKALKEEMETTVKMIQGKYGVDVFGLSNYVQRYHPKVWNKIKDNWEEAFVNSVVKVDIKCHIRRIGVSK